MINSLIKSFENLQVKITLEMRLYWSCKLHTINSDEQPQ